MALPPEIHLTIIRHLRPHPLSFLRSTSTYFRRLIPPLTHHQNLEIENVYASHNNFYACRPCLRLLHIYHFEDHALNQDEQYVYKPQDPEWRFCVSCGTRPLTGDAREDASSYFIGARWMYRGEKWERCLKCKECKSRSSEAGPESGIGRVWVLVCDECHPLFEEEMET